MWCSIDVRAVVRIDMLNGVVVGRIWVRWIGAVRAVGPLCLSPRVAEGVKMAKSSGDSGLGIGDDDLGLIWARR